MHKHCHQPFLKVRSSAISQPPLPGSIYRPSKKLTCFIDCLLVAALVTGLSGCSTFISLGSQERRVSYHGEAAKVNVSVDAIAPWDEYKDLLTTNFKLTEIDALNQVVPTTNLQNEQRLDAIQTLLNISPYTTSVEKSKTETVTDGVLAKSSSKTSTRKPGSAAAPEPDGVTSLLTAAGFPDALKSTVNMDPFLKFQAAQALYQEVKMLNAFLKDAVIVKDYEPYLVRMSVHINPLGLNLPYDTDMSFSFFLGDRGNIHDLENTEYDDKEFASTSKASSGDTEPTAADDDQDTRPKPDEKPKSIEKKVYEVETLEKALANASIKSLFSKRQYENLSRNKENPEASILASYSDITEFSPIVLPLLVRDNLEAAISSQSESSIREFGLKLALLKQGNAFGGSFNNNLNKINEVFGRNINSLYSVSRTGKNTLNVFIGAPKNGYGNREMVRKNHSVTFVMLVPKMVSEYEEDKVAIRTIQLTKFVDPKDGTRLKSNSIEFLHASSIAAFEKLGTINVPAGADCKDWKKFEDFCPPVRHRNPASGSQENTIQISKRFSCFDELAPAASLAVNHSNHTDYHRLLNAAVNCPIPGQLGETATDTPVIRDMSFYSRQLLWAYLQDVEEKRATRAFYISLPKLVIEPTWLWEPDGKDDILPTLVKDKNQYKISLIGLPTPKRFDYIGKLCISDNTNTGLPPCFLPNQSSFSSAKGTLDLAFDIPMKDSTEITPDKLVLKVQTLSKTATIGPIWKFAPDPQDSTKKIKILSILSDDGIALYKAPQPPKETNTDPLVLTAHTTQIVSDKEGKGTLKLYLTIDKKVATEAKLQFAGADIESINDDNAPFKQGKNEFVISDSQALTVSFSNLYAHKKVSVSASAKGSSGKSIQFDVVSGKHR